MNKGTYMKPISDWKRPTGTIWNCSGYSCQDQTITLTFKSLIGPLDLEDSHPQRFNNKGNITLSVLQVPVLPYLKATLNLRSVVLRVNKDVCNMGHQLLRKVVLRWSQSLLFSFFKKERKWSIFLLINILKYFFLRNCSLKSKVYFTQK